MAMKIEACCGCARDVFLAKELGVARAELSFNLPYGGLTPSIGEFTLALEAGLPLVALVRPRTGGFMYDEYEVRAMELDTKAFVKAGACGIAFGALTAEGDVDKEICKRIMAHCDGVDTVFNRAFDLTRFKWKTTLSQIIELGFTRLLTSGCESNAIMGAERIFEMREFAGDAIEILPGAGISRYSLPYMRETSGTMWVHASMGRKQYMDETENFQKSIFFTPDTPHELGYDGMDLESAAEFVKAAALV